MAKSVTLLLLVCLSITSLAACTSLPIQPIPLTAASPAPGEADLSGLKTYTLENASRMQANAGLLHQTAQTYYNLLAVHNFDYQAAWQTNQAELTELVASAKRQWLDTSLHYELNEGIVAGVPGLAHFDVLIDAGPSEAEAPGEALDWTLELPNGEKLARPGNYFHSLLEPTIWGTQADFTGAQVDLDGDGQIELGEALPDANVFLAAAQGLDETTQELSTAVQAWQPTLADAFTALAVMIPTMSEYFEQWQLSTYIAGEDSQQAAFVGTSRLFDVTNILHGLQVTYQNISPQVRQRDAGLDGQILAGFEDLNSYVADLYQREQQGERFTADQATLFGTEAQNRAAALVGQVVQAAALLDVPLANE